MKLMIDVETEKSALYLKKELEEQFPLLDGKVQILKEALIVSLSEIISNERKANSNLQ